MAKKIIDSYEYKEAPKRQAMEYVAFGWQIGRNSEHYSSKERKDVVTMRRDIAIGANPTIHDFEKSYLKLERGKLPLKYRNKPILKGIFKCLLILLTIAVLAVGVGLITVGVYDGFKVEKRSRAIYNTLVELSMTEDKLIVDVVEENGSALTDGYIEFAKENPTLDTFAELIDYNNGKTDEEVLLKTYKNWLVKFGLASKGVEESFEAADPSVVPDEFGYYVNEEDTIGGIFDLVRQYVSFVNFDGALEAMPIWLNTFSLMGAAALILFVLLIIIESAVRKRNKKKKRQKCVLLMRDCVKKSTDALYDLKMENRELMTKKDMQLYDLETMFTQVMQPSGDDDFD